MIEKIQWGIIGCGDVTELKSGPAFNKVKDSVLLAVMRRDEAKAKDYAQRHGVAKYYTQASELINDPEINAIYIATPPNSHEAYAMASIAAGKPVYVEKPMTVNHLSALRMKDAAEANNVKLVVAHYRRAQPMFNNIKQLLDDKSIGDVLCVKLDYRQPPLSAELMSTHKMAWRLDPKQSGGGLFHDLAPHQLGLMVYYFGEVQNAYGVSANRGGKYAADDLVNGIIQFKNAVQFNGSWCFNVMPEDEMDRCEIFGTEGSIVFPVFGTSEIILNTWKGKERISFDPLQHVQQPMIEKVVQYFLGKIDNPCPAKEGVAVLELMDKFCEG
jgi:predicted dehydrogenase